MTTALIVGIIAAAAGATAGLWGSLIDDKNAREEAARHKQHVEEEYALKRRDAELNFNAAKEKADRNARQQELQADLTDKSLDVTELGLSNDFNAAIDQMYLSQEADAYEWNSQAMQMGSEEGAALASAAASGVRAGSSLSDAVEMQSATNAAQLQFSQDAKRRSDDNNLAGVLNNLAGNMYGIQQNRIGADYTRDEAKYLRNSYLEGGYNYNLYQNQLAMLDENVKYQTEMLDKEYAKHSGFNSFANAFIAFNSGGTKGFSTGYNIGSSFQNASAPNYDVGGK